MWKHESPDVVVGCWNMLVSLHDELLNEWGMLKNQYIPNQDGIDFTELYRIAVAKRVSRRKSSAVRKYEDIDEYVDNMYLNE
jgi:hypothetical protein